MPTRLFSSRSRFTEEREGRESSRPIATDLGAWSRKGASRSLNGDRFTLATLAVSRRRAGTPLFLAVAHGLSVAGSLEARSTWGSEREPEGLLKEAWIGAHLDVIEEGKTQAGRAGRSATLTAGLVLWPRAHILHAGDSRCYRLHRGTLERLTIDHPFDRRISWNPLGGDPRMPEPQMAAVDLEPGDGLLLTTAGLTDALGDSELAEKAGLPCSAHAVCHMLVETAAARGLREDATALLARFDPVPA